MDLIYVLSGEELYNRALIFKQKQDYDTYIIYITMAANYGYPDAIDNIYKCNTYKKQNYTVTKNFYETTALNNNMANAYSVHFLAYMYENGLGVKLDYIKAIALYKISINKGCHYSSFNLADKYENGIGCETDYNKAIELYEVAIKKGIIEALTNLGSLYFNRSDGNKDYVKTKYFYKKAIKKGETTALNNLACLYINGLGCKKNYSKAIYYYEKAIESGNISKLNDLILIYKNNMHADYDKIIKLYNIGISVHDLTSIIGLKILLRIDNLETEISMT